MRNKRLLQVIGLIWLVTSLVWVILFGSGVYYGWTYISVLDENIDQAVGMVMENVELFQGVLNETLDIFAVLDQTMQHVEATTDHAAGAIDDTRPLVMESAQVVTQDVPDALQGLQSSMPAVIEAAGYVDRTLLLLSLFNFEIPNPLGEPLSVGLGVDYAPTVPLEVALEDLSQYLVDIPDDLRKMEDDLSLADKNLGQISDDVSVLANDVGAINAEIMDYEPQIREMKRNLLYIERTLRLMRRSLPTLFAQLRIGFVFIGVFLILGQIPGIYLGVMFLRGDGVTSPLELKDED